MTAAGPAPRASWIARLDRPLISIVAVYLFVGTFLVIPRITTDGLQYFGQTRSVIFDGDLDLDDEYRFEPSLVSPGASEGRREFLPRDLDGRFLHSANEGIVVLFAPFFLLGHGLSAVIAALGGGVSMDGYDMPYVLAVAFGSSALVALAMVLLARFAAVRVGWKSAVLGACAVWLGSSLVHWSLFRPAHAHAPAVLLETVLVLLFLGRGRDPRMWGAWLAMGVAWGLLISVRPIGGLYALVPAGWLAWRLVTRVMNARRGGGAPDDTRDAGGFGAAVLAGLREVVPAGLAFLVGGVLGRLPQVVLTGDLTLTGSSYYDESGFLADRGGDPLSGLLSLLFDAHQGTLLWVPLVGLSLIGLAGYWRRDRLVTVAGLAWVAAIWLFVATLGDPERFGGPTYASRHLVEATPIYVLGAAGIPAVFGALWPRRRRALKVVGALVVVAATSWGVLQYAATEVVPGAAALTPFERFGRVVDRPSQLSRLLVTPSRDAGPGPVFVAGRAIAAIEGESDIRDALLGVAVLAILAGGVVVVAGPAWRLVAGRDAATPVHSDADADDDVDAEVGSLSQPRPGRAPARVAWLVIALVVGAAILPAVMRPRIASDDGTRVAAVWTGAASEAPDGQVRAITIGHSATGNEGLSPPVAAPGEPGGVGSGTAVAFASTANGLEGSVISDSAWTALAGVVVELEEGAAHDGLEAWVARPDRPPAVISRVVSIDPATGETTFTLPLSVAYGEGEALRVGLRAIDPDSGSVPRAAVTASGELVVRPLGVRAVLPPTPEVGGSELVPDAWATTPLPEQASLVVRSDGTAAMRLGAWDPELMLRNAAVVRGWRIPGPSAAPGTWTDSLLPTPDGGPIAFRLTAPWSIRSATAHAMVTTLDRTDPTGVVIEGSTDGANWQPLATLEPAPVVRQQHLAGTFQPEPEATTVFVRVSIVGNPDAVGLNAVWFDLALDPRPGVLDRADAASVAVTDAATRSALVEVVVATRPSAIEALAFAVADAVTGVARALPALALLIAAAVLAVVAVLAARRSDAWLAAAMGTIAIAALAIGLAGLPRQVSLPRTQSVASGVVVDGVAIGTEVLSETAGATWDSPIVSVPAGGLVRDVRLDGDLAGATVQLRTIATDGTPGSWQASSGPITTDGDGVQVRVTFAAPEQVLTGVRLTIEPPIGG